MNDTSGPAFPVAQLPSNIGTVSEADAALRGISMRDYFAAHAPPLPGFVRDSFVRAGKRGADMDLREHAEVCAQWAGLYADAMLRARGGK